MSDGNYNRNLLPYNNYRSGLKAGMAQMRTRAIAAFTAYLEQQRPQATAEELAEAKTLFVSLL